MDLVESGSLMKLFSRPRPTGSAAAHATADAIRAWLAARGIAARTQVFTLYPFFFESLGAWLIATRTLLAVSIVRRWGWPAPLLALAGLLGGAVDILTGRPVVTGLGARRGENILLEFGPPDAERTLVVAAHYDSKTELLDHRRRAALVRRLPHGIILTLLLGVLGPLDRLLARRGSALTLVVRVLALAATGPLLVLAWGLGLNLLPGRLIQPSTGAVDNGAACAVILGLAEALHRRPPQRARVVLALFDGEEANMQGSRAYVQSLRASQRAGTTLVNLELLGQNGEYVVWQQDGNALRKTPTTAHVNHLVIDAVGAVTSSQPQHLPLINSDAASFLFAGMPAAVLGSTDRVLGVDGMHRPSDHPGRVQIERLPESVAILVRIVEQFAG